MDPNLLSKSDVPVAQSSESYPNQDNLATESATSSQMKNYDFKHSGPGIASFVISLITIVGYIGLFLFIVVNATSMVTEDGSLTDDSSQAIMLLGLSVLTLAALNVIGVVVGIIGLSLRQRRKVLGIIGTIINGLIILLFMLITTIFLVNAGTL